MFKIGSSPALLPAAGLCLGIWLADELRLAPNLAWALCGISTFLLGLTLLAGRRISSFFFGITVITAFVGFGFLRLTLALPSNNLSHYIHQNASNEPIVVRLTELLNPTESAIRWKASAISISGKPVTGELLVQIPKNIEVAHWMPSDRIVIFGSIIQPKHVSNPHAFDYRAYLQNQGVYGIVYLKPGMHRHQHEKYLNFKERIGRLRLRLINRLEHSDLGTTESELAQSLLLGYRALEADQYKKFQKAGAAHILAVSGLHVGIFSALLGGLLWPLRRLKFGRIIHGLLLILLLWGYVLLAGAGPAIVRAAVLFTLLTYAVLQEKAGQSMHFWAMAILILLGIIEPRWMFQTGFQLSFVPVWSILVFYPKLYQLWPYKKGVWAYFGQLNCLGISAQIGVLPLSLYYFHQFPLHFLLSNILLVPAMGVVLGWGYVLLILSFIDVMPGPLLEGYGFVLRVILFITDRLGSFDSLVITQISWGKVALALSLVAILSFAGWLTIGRLKGALIGFCCLIALDAHSVWETAKAGSTDAWIVPHRAGESSVWNRNGFNLTVYSGNPEAHSVLADQYATAEGVKSIRYAPLDNSYTVGNIRLLRIDASGCYPKTNYHPDVVLLSESAPIHLEMALNYLKPQRIIADGSNYPSDLARWEKTCKEYGIPFHATAQKGAFQLKISKMP